VNPTPIQPNPQTDEECAKNFSTDLAWNNFPVKFDLTTAGLEVEWEEGQYTFKLDNFSDSVKNYLDSLTTKKPFFKTEASSNWPNEFENGFNSMGNLESYSTEKTESNGNAGVDIDVYSQSNIISYNWFADEGVTLSIGTDFGCYPKGSNGLLGAHLSASTNDVTQLNSYLTSFISQLTAKGFKCATLSTASSSTQGLEECLDASASPRNDWGEREVDITDSNNNGSSTDEAQAMTSIGFLCANNQCTAPMGYPYLKLITSPSDTEDTEEGVDLTLSSEDFNAANSTDSYSFPDTNVSDDAASDSTAQDTWTTDLSACLENSSSNCLTPKFKYSDVFQFPEFILPNSIYQYQRYISFDTDYNSALNFSFSTSPHFSEYKGTESDTFNYVDYDLTPYMMNSLYSSTDVVTNNAFLDKYSLVGASLTLSFAYENILDASLFSLQEIPDSAFDHVFGLDPENTQYLLSSSSKDYYIDFGETSNADPSKNEDINKYETELENDGFTCTTSQSDKFISCYKSFPASDGNGVYSNVVFQWSASNAEGSYFGMSWGWSLQ
jgi:hypothetical protein